MTGYIWELEYTRHGDRFTEQFATEREADDRRIELNRAGDAWWVGQPHKVAAPP